MGVKFANNAYGTLNASITSSDTSLTLSSGQGARFPSLGAGDYFYVTLIDTSNNLEIAKCTARSSDVLTITRGQEGTTSRAYSVGDRVELRITAAGLDEIQPAIDDLLPSQTGNSGKYLTTNGTASSWGTVDLTNLSASNLTSGTLSNARMFAGGIINAAGYDFTTRVSLAHSSYTDYFTGSFTKQRSSSNIIAMIQANGRSDANGATSSRFVMGSSTVTGGSKYTTTVHTDIVNQVFYITGNTQTGSLSWAYAQSYNTFAILNPNSSDDARISGSTSRVVILEVVA